MMLTDSRDDMFKQEKIILASRKKIEGNIEKLQKKAIVLPKGKELLQHVLDNRIKYIEGSKKLVTLIEEGIKDDSRTYLTHVLRPILSDYHVSLSTFGKYYVELMHVTVQEAVDNYKYPQLDVGADTTSDCFGVGRKSRLLGYAPCY